MQQEKCFDGLLVLFKHLLVQLCHFKKIYGGIMLRTVVSGHKNNGDKMVGLRKHASACEGVYTDTKAHISLRKLVQAAFWHCLQKGINL
jgi:hypothetical protein